MSDPSPAIEDEDERALDEGAELQFDQAEPLTPTSSGPTCAACKRPIEDAYFEINGKVVCTSCRARIVASFRGGSRIARVLKATSFGIVGAIAGAVLYYAIWKATGYHLGLVAILVGFMVGGAVKKGTGGRGGLFYQLLALFLTYSSIVAFHVPLLFEEPTEPEGQQQPAVIAPEAPNAKPANQKGKAASKALSKGENRQKPAEKAPAANPDDAAVQKAVAVHHENAVAAEKAPGGPLSRPKFVLLLIVVLVSAIGFLYSLPVQLSIQNPLLGLILGFALWEAWKITKRAELAFSGPFRVNPDIPRSATPEVSGDGG